MNQKQSARALALVLNTLLFSLTCSDRAAAANAVADQRVLRDKILNSICCVPNMSSGYTPRVLKHGKFKAMENGCLIDIELDSVIFGKLENKPIALAVLYDCEGGSGVFESLLLYDLQNGKAVIAGSHPVGDRAEIKLLSIRNNVIRLVSAKFRGAEKPQLMTELIKRKDFDKAECIQYELSKETKSDIAKLMATYITVWSDKPLTAEQKQEALAICRRHQGDRARFADEFRLSLDAQGYGSGPHPLTFNQTNEPVLHLDDERKQTHVSIELSK